MGGLIMKKHFILFYLLLIGITAIAQQTTIEDIIANPGRFDKESVETKGTVTQYTRGTASTTAYYLLKGEYGGIIQVNTAEGQPNINRIYSVKGTVVSEMGTPLIIEHSKTCIDCPEPPVPPIEEHNNNTLIIIIVAGIILIIILIVVLQMQKKKETSTYIPESPGQDPSTIITKDDTVIITRDRDFETIRIEENVPKTMKFMPGKLEIISGADKGKSFMLAGYPTQEGAIVTLGRDYSGWEKQVPGDRKYSHIRIKDETRTLSRMQAELIYKEGTLYIKNVGSVNKTQVDGLEINENDKVEVKPNAIIKAGNIEFKYIV